MTRSGPSVAERYTSREDYLQRIRQSADAPVQKGCLLADDLSRVMQRAGDTWDLVVRDVGTQR